jgi:hypothetical protein
MNCRWSRASRRPSGSSRYLTQAAGHVGLGGAARGGPAVTDPLHVGPVPLTCDGPEVYL